MRQSIIGAWSTILPLLVLAGPVHADPPDPEHITLQHYLEGLIADLRHDAEVSDRTTRDRLDLVERRSDEALAQHKIDDRTLQEAIRAVDSRVSLIDGINATVQALTGRVDRITQSIVELQTSSSATSSSATGAAVRLEEGAKATALRLETMQVTIDRNSDRLTKLETGGSQGAQETAAELQKAEARLTAIESAATGANWVWTAMLVVVGVVLSAIGTYAMLHPLRTTTARR